MSLATQIAPLDPTNMSLVPFVPSPGVDPSSLDAEGQISNSSSNVLRDVANVMEDAKFRSFFEQHLLDDPESVLMLMWVYATVHKNTKMVSKHDKTEIVRKLIRDTHSRGRIMDMHRQRKALLCTP